MSLFYNWLEFSILFCLKMDYKKDTNVITQRMFKMTVDSCDKLKILSK